MITPYTARVCATFNSQNKTCFYHIKKTKTPLKIRGSNFRNKMLEYKRMFINKIKGAKYWQQVTHLKKQ